jgi:hypothetical protein
LILFDPTIVDFSFFFSFLHFLPRSPRSPRPGDYEVTVSHLEIYQEELNDLLSPLNDAESLTARLSKRRFTTSLALATALKKRGIQITYDPKQNHSLAVDALR